MNEFLSRKNANSYSRRSIQIIDGIYPTSLFHTYCFVFDIETRTGFLRINQYWDIMVMIKEFMDIIVYYVQPIIGFTMIMVLFCTFRCMLHSSSSICDRIMGYKTGI